MVQKPYLFANDLTGRRADVVALAKEAEARGFPGVFSESPGDNLALSLAVLDRTERIVVGRSVAKLRPVGRCPPLSLASGNTRDLPVRERPARSPAKGRDAPGGAIQLNQRNGYDVCVVGEGRDPDVKTAQQIEGPQRAARPGWRTGDRWGSRGPFARAAQGGAPLRRAWYSRLSVRAGGKEAPYGGGLSEGDHRRGADTPVVVQMAERAP
ncbi:MAG TPA: hypothetical protein VIZ60_15750 [Rubrobacter sp.]